MTDPKQSPEKDCEHFELLMMRRIDGEISPEDDTLLDNHLASCPSCANRFSQYSRLAAATAQVEMPELADEIWERYWAGVYNRLERRLAWVLVSLGAVATITYFTVRLIIRLINDPDIALWAKVGVLALIGGFTLLFVSVLRERLAVAKTDKYRHIKR